MSRKAKLADHEDVHRSPERLRHFVRDRDAAPGKGENDQVGAVNEVLEPGG
jgi:hypothetical protein